MPLRLALGLLAAIALVPPPARAATGWRWPLRGPIADAYRYREATPFLAGQRRGIVIAAPAGAAVRAACAGRVSFAGRTGPAGRGVSVACGALTATYMRLAEVAVRRGDDVAAGDRLGRLGARGLHLGARLRSRRWAYVDPLRLLAGDPGPGAPPAPPVAVGRRPRRPWALGAAPARQPVPRWFPLLRPLRLRPLGSPDGGVPLVAWLGLGLLAGAVPALGLRRRRQRRREGMVAGAPAAHAPSDAA